MWQIKKLLTWAVSPQGINVISAALSLWAALADNPLWPGLAMAGFLLAMACVG